MSEFAVPKGTMPHVDWENFPWYPTPPRSEEPREGQLVWKVIGRYGDTKLTLEKPDDIDKPIGYISKQDKGIFFCSFGKGNNRKQ